MLAFIRVISLINGQISRIRAGLLTMRGLMRCLHYGLRSENLPLRAKTLMVSSRMWAITLGDQLADILPFYGYDPCSLHSFSEHLYGTAHPQVHVASRDTVAYRLRD